MSADSKTPANGTNTSLGATTNANNANSLYHERQSRALCLLHALNNLFQGVAYDKQTLDHICKELSPDSYYVWNPHKSSLGIGNYDVNVLLKALQQKDCTAVWFDHRKDPSCLDLDNVLGFIINRSSSKSLGPIPIPFYPTRHWYTIRLVADAWHNFDSKLSEPALIGHNDALLRFLCETLLETQTQPADKQQQIFVIVSNQVDKDMTYLHPPYRTNDNTPIGNGASK